MLASCACAPVRNPPPGFFADTNTRHATVPPSRRVAWRLVSLVTSMAGGTRPGAGTLTRSPDPYMRVPATAAVMSPARSTSCPAGERYRPSSTIVTVCLAMARSLALTAVIFREVHCLAHRLFREPAKRVATAGRVSRADDERIDVEERGPGSIPVPSRSDG